MNYTIYYEDKFETLDDLATKSRFMIEEYTTYDNAVNTTTFESGLDAVNYIEMNKLLQNEYIPMLSFSIIWTNIALKISKMGF